MSLRCSGLAVVGFTALIGFPHLLAQEGPQSFAYVGSSHVIVAEVAGSNKFIVNIINLSDYVIVVQPQYMIMQGGSGRYYVGQVFDRPHTDGHGATHRYSASVMLKGHVFEGLDVLGAFPELSQIRELSLRIGAKRYYLDGMDSVRFEQLIAKIGELDMENSNVDSALADANIPHMGKLSRSDGTPEWESDWKGLLVGGGVNPPKVLKRADIVPTEEAIRKKVHGRLKLNVTISRSGGIQDLTIVKGLGRGLDERALETVHNAWEFLPATRNGEVLETTFDFEIVVPRATGASADQFLR